MRRQFSGAFVTRVIDPSHARVPEHAHDWPVLSLFVLGRYLNQTDLGVVSIEGPSAIFYQAGAAHHNVVGPDGFEQIEIEFDPDWIGTPSMPDVPVSHWIGGNGGAAARVLARSCLMETDAKRLRDAVRGFLRIAGSESVRTAPSWIGPVRRRLCENTAISVDALAREVGRHPSYLGAAYQAHIGEGLMQTTARIRVERAARALRETAASCAVIAVEAGFYDQSHMNRTFQRLLGRAPTQVRRERVEFRSLAMSNTTRRAQWPPGRADGTDLFGWLSMRKGSL